MTLEDALEKVRMIDRAARATAPSLGLDPATASHNAMSWAIVALLTKRTADAADLIGISDDGLRKGVE